MNYVLGCKDNKYFIIISLFFTKSMKYNQRMP